MNKAEIARHLQIKKKVPHYPQLPRFITLAGTKKYTGSKFSKELKESCLRGFYKRLANWSDNKENQKFLMYHDPKFQPVVDEVEEVEEEVTDEVAG